ncbi:MAG: iron-containing alcohol dehydrogenase [Bacteroidales bacterium]|nr:iron-containing alcohol dehydrogenase [Bacteroidales bacterium]
MTYNIPSISIDFPKKLVFGDQSLNAFIKYFLPLGHRNVFLLADPNVRAPLEKLRAALTGARIKCIVNTGITHEPTVSEFEGILSEAESNRIDSVIGLGGGSVLDVAKLVSALCYSKMSVSNTFGSGNISARKLFLACLPTTAGTGSEVSPNSILLDESDQLKKGIVSPFLVPDATFVDPELTHSVPPAVTAATGIDALTHCIEAYANKNAHPLIDTFALQGIDLICHNLETACSNGKDSKARSAVALGSMYGGLCLGPVNTAAVHALAYPLGSEYKIAHGVSNALLLPHVLEFNLPAGVERYADIARIIGVKDGGSKYEMARKGIEKISGLCRNIGIPGTLAGFNVSREHVPSLAKSAISVQRLLKNNLREVSEKDAIEIYYKLF